MDAIRIEEAGALRRDADVADLLAHLTRATEEGSEFVEVRAGEGKVTLRGWLGSYDAYRSHRMPLLYALAATGALGGGGRLTFLGESEGEVVTLFVDVAGDELRIDEPDPQNLDEEDREERLGGQRALGRTRRGGRRRSAAAGEDRGAPSRGASVAALGARGDPGFRRMDSNHD